MTNQAQREIVAAGGVLWRPGPEIAVVHRPRYDDWSLPKGKLEVAEHPLDAACREIIEETGIEPTVGPSLGTVHYLVSRPGAPSAPKTVHYWALRARGGEFTPNKEVDELRWVRPSEATLSYAHDRDVVARFAALPRVTGTVLLLRHGLAGTRPQWAGDDRLRPLDAEGQAQALALARVLPWYGPSRILSADRVRCRQTVEPLAAATGLAVQTEPLLAEEAYRFDPPRTVALLRSLGASGDVVVASSQGGVIPDLITGLAAADHVELGSVRSAKGSLWALFFDGRRLVAADYVPDLVR